MSLIFIPLCSSPADYARRDFEDDTCDWSQDTNDQAQFLRMIGPSDDNYMTGPYRDHTTQYMGMFIVGVKTFEPQ